MKEAIAVLAPRYQSCICFTLNHDQTDNLAKEIETVFCELEAALNIPFVELQGIESRFDAFTHLLDQVDKRAGLAQLSCLLVVGRVVDEQMTTAILAGLVKGYDVYLLCDFLAPSRRIYCPGSAPLEQKA